MIWLKLTQFWLGYDLASLLSPSLVVTKSGELVAVIMCVQTFINRSEICPGLWGIFFDGRFEAFVKTGQFGEDMMMMRGPGLNKLCFGVELHRVARPPGVRAFQNPAPTSPIAKDTSVVPRVCLDPKSTGHSHDDLPMEKMSNNTPQLAQDTMEKGVHHLNSTS